MRVDCVNLRELSPNLQWSAWRDLPLLDKYVLQFARLRFDQEFKAPDGHLFRMVYDGRSIRVPFATELDPKSRSKLDMCDGIIADLDGQNVLYYRDP